MNQKVNHLNTKRKDLMNYFMQKYLLLTVK